MCGCSCRDGGNTEGLSFLNATKNGFSKLFEQLNEPLRIASLLS